MKITVDLLVYLFMMCFAGLVCCLSSQHYNGGSNVAVWPQEAVAVKEQQFEEERQQVRMERKDAERKVRLFNLHSTLLHIGYVLCVLTVLSRCLLSYK